MKRVDLFRLSLLLFATAAFTACGGGSKTADIELYPVKSGDNYEYVNRKGEIVINPQFTRATVFRNGVALVRQQGSEEWGYINPKGKFVSEQRYREATTFSEGLAWATAIDQAPAAINPKGAVQFTMKEAMKVRNFHNGLAAFYDIKGRWGFVDTKGNIKIEPKFIRNVGDFSEDLCAAIDSATWKWGYINTRGEFEINPQFDEAGKFENGLAVVELGDKYGVIDKKGKYIINPQFDSMEADGDWYLVEQDDKQGWCDRQGKFVINPQFRYASGFYDNPLAPVRSSGDSKWGYIDRKGTFVINPQFDNAAPFCGNLALIQTGERIGFIDKQGKYAVNPQFSDIANDVLNYLAGKSTYDTVESDYFSAEDVVAAFDFNSPEGLTAAANYWDIVGKFGVGQNDFNKYNEYHTVIKDKKIGTKVTCSFTVNGFPYDKQVSGDWWASTKYVFNGDRTPKSYTYEIKTGEHTEEIIHLLDKKLSENHSSYWEENYGSYSNDIQEITIDEHSPYITVSIVFKKTADTE